MNFKLQIYNEECLKLTKSLLIKSDMLARDVEYNLTGDISYLDKPRTEWKYYLNISGEYHSSNEVMYITSLDTLKDIEFSKANLEDHPITKSKYRVNDDLTNKLLKKYPNNALLIRGIIYSVDINTAIDAEEYSILTYDTTLVGNQEINLMPQLEARLKNEFTTWVNKDYHDVENYYATINMAHVAKQSLYYIKLIRLSNYKTAFACDFYVWNHINSFLYLEDLKSSISTEDIFYLYKNIERMVKEAGSNSVLEEIINNFLIPKDISTYRLTAIMDTTLVDDIEPSISTRYLEYPMLEDKEFREVEFSSYITHSENTSNTTLDNYTEDMARRLSLSSDKAPLRMLKVFEVIKDSVDSQILLTDIDMHVQAVLEGVYSTIHSIPDHISGNIYTLTTHECIILYLYLVKRRLGSATDIIEPHYLYLNPVTVKPSVNYLVENYGISKDSAQAILDTVVDYPTDYLSRTEMDKLIKDYKISQKNILREIRKATNRDNQYLVSRMYKEFYISETVDLINGEVTYSDWLFSRDFNFDDYEELDYTILEEVVLNNAFNIYLDVRASNYVNAITALMNRLNNYRIEVSGYAESANLVDYHVGTLFSSHSISKSGFVDRTEVTVDQLASIVSGVRLVDYPTIDTNNKTSVVIDTPAYIKATSNAIKYKSTVVTSMTSQYDTNLDLRNQNGQRS